MLALHLSAGSLSQSRKETLSSFNPASFTHHPAIHSPQLSIFTLPPHFYNIFTLFLLSFLPPHPLYCPPPRSFCAFTNFPWQLFQGVLTRDDFMCRNHSCLIFLRSRVSEIRAWMDIIDEQSYRN